MNLGQLRRLLRVLLFATAFMLACEIVFSLKAVNEFFTEFITSKRGFLLFVAIWVIMFLQVTVLDVPAYVILSASVSIGIEVLGWEYLLTVISAYMCGCVCAYAIGRTLGIRAVKWCAGTQEDFDKWSTFLNTKGKLWYFLTVLLPLFPDDMLCLVAGAVKFSFRSFFISNLIGRSIGLVAMLFALKLAGEIGGANFPFLAVVWAIALVLETTALIIIRKKLKNIAKNS